MLTELEVARLDAVIEKLNAAPVQPLDEALKKNKVYRTGAIRRMLSSGETYGEASGAMQHLNRPDVKEYMQSIDNDIVKQIEILDECIDLWFSHGEHLAPYYPWRVTVILRKNEAFDSEHRFLAAYCKHFYSVLGNRDAKIAARAVKIGAV